MRLQGRGGYLFFEVWLHAFLEGNDGNSPYTPLTQFLGEQTSNEECQQRPAKARNAKNTSFAQELLIKAVV